MSEHLEAVRKAISEDQVVDLTSELIRIPSMNNFGDERFLGDDYSEKNVARVVADRLRQAGCRVDMTEVLPGRPNVIATLEGESSTDVLLFEAHMDTIRAVDSGDDPFRPRIEGGRLFGLGSCDTKGSLAAMIAAMETLVRLGRRPPCTIALAATVDEEYKYRGVSHLIQSGVRASSAVVGEPTELQIVIAHKGCIRWRTETIGRFAHSSHPEKGVNAIYKMAQVINCITGEILPECASRHHPLVGSPTLNIGVIRGGVQANIVPARCEIDVDRRLIPGEAPDSVFQAFCRRMKGIGEGDPDFQVVVHEPYLIDPPLETCQESEIVRAARSVTAAITGKDEVTGVSYGTDASKLSAAGIPSIVLGPGSIRQAHAPQEFVPVAELVRAAQIYAGLMLSYKGGME